MRQIHSILIYKFPVLFTNFGKLWNEREKRFLAYIAASAYHVISKEGENPSLGTTEFLDK